MQMPLTAIVAVTYRCNSRCKMCDIWKKQASKVEEMLPADYAMLPETLRDINITGGEPFLRDDLYSIIEVLKKTCPLARIVISTNGFLVDRIRSTASELLRLDPDIAIRVSIDGLGYLHDDIRGVPHAFEKATESISVLREAGIKDLGIAVTLMQANEGQLLEIYRFAASLGLEFSVTLVSSSDSYFGAHKYDLRPKTTKQLEAISKYEYSAWGLRRWFRGWFADTLANYAATGKRQLACDAGSGFFYLDPYGSMYACHLKQALIGNLSAQGFMDIWHSEQAGEARLSIGGCEDCWMVCTCKSEILRKRAQIGYRILRGKVKTFAQGRRVR